MDLSALKTIRIAACDLNGIPRGKRLPAAIAAKLDQGAVRMPISTMNVDIWGRDIADSPLVFETGDADGILLPTDRKAVPMPWLGSPSALILCMMHHLDGQPFLGDPRQCLTHVLNRYRTYGWSVLAATELEFTLVDDSSGAPRAPKDPVTKRPLTHQSVLSLDELDHFDAFFTELYESSETMGIPAQSAISEAGLGQFEINLNHQDALRAADDTWLFKMLVKGLARKHGFAATFMAKPNPEEAGNGMHVHFSIVDQDGRNIFDNGGDEGTATLHSAVAGCLAAMADSTLIFAPHGNSYDRLVPGAHAPTAAAWAYENRTAAIRIPAGPGAARRIEHRVAGGDINPYLTLSAILSAALHGIETEMTPPPPITGNAYAVEGLDQLAPTWAEAIERFATSDMIKLLLPQQMIDSLVMTKRQECTGFKALDPALHWQSWLDAV